MIFKWYRTYKFKVKVAEMSNTQLDYEKRRLKDFNKTDEIMEKEIRYRKKYPLAGAIRNNRAIFWENINRKENKNG